MPELIRIPDAGSEVRRRAELKGRKIQPFEVSQDWRLWIFVLLVSCLSSRCFADSIINLTPDNIPRDLGVLKNVPDGVTVRFAPGAYFFTKPILLREGADRVTIEPTPGGRVEITAGQLVQGWKPAKLNGHDCYSAELLAVRMGIWNFRELWVNGARATRCRYPATGYLFSVQAKDDLPWNQGQSWFGYKPGDLPDQLPAEAEALLMNRWAESHLPIDSIDPRAHQFRSKRKTVFHPIDGDPYFLEGAPQWFEHPGDWYLDHTEGVLYYFPRKDESINNLVAVTPTRDQIFIASHATNLTIRNFTFCHSEWNLPEPLIGDEPSTGGFAQAEYGVTAAVSLKHCSDCLIESCRFEHLGNYALELGQGCHHDRIERCVFRDMGAGAIKIGETNIRGSNSDQSFGNTISDCRISDGGHLFPSACGIWVGQSADNLIVHNAISDLYYTAISIGWTWGYGPSLCKGNRIESNLVHDIGKKSDGSEPILSDMGAIYTLGARARTVIRGNVFHDITGRVYGGWGIYLDEGSSDVLVEKNLVYRTTHGGFHVNYGQNNTVRNNIFALNRDIQIARTRVEKGPSYSFENNIVYWNTGIFTATKPDALHFDNNLYFCTGDGKLTFGEKSFSQWQSAGQDTHSLLADPEFKDPLHGNFSLATNSPAKQIQFEPLSFDDAGPRTR